MKIQLKVKLAIILVSISLLTSVLYGVDKFTSNNPADAASIRIGLSDKDSSSCQECLKNGIFFNSGCKKCEQDGVVFMVNVGKDRSYSLGWSNNHGMYDGDKNCDGKINFKNLKSNENQTFWVELVKNDLELSSTIYSDSNFSKIIDSVSTKMCSNPTEMKYVRISNEDGKPTANGGVITGFIDNIEISNISTNLNKKTESIFFENFDECIDESCSNSWILQNSKNLSINPSEKIFQYYSKVSGTNDYAHSELNEQKLNNSWNMKFKLHISELIPHPLGKGIINIQPDLRQLFFGIPSLFLPVIGFLLSKHQSSKSLGIIILLSGIIIFFGIFYSILNNQTHSNIDMIQLSIILPVNVLILLLGIRKIQK